MTNHPTIGLVEIFLAFILSGTIFLEIGNLWEGLVDRKFAFKALDESAREAVDLAVTMDRVLIVVSSFLFMLAVRGMYRPESQSSIATSVIYFIAICVCVYCLLVSIKGRKARWRILRPTIGQASDTIVVGKETTLNELARLVEKVDQNVEAGSAAAQRTAADVSAALAMRTLRADSIEGEPGEAADAASRTPEEPTVP